MARDLRIRLNTISIQQWNITPYENRRNVEIWRIIHYLERYLRVGSLIKRVTKTVRLKTISKGRENKTIHHEIDFGFAKARTVSFLVENCYHGDNIRLLYSIVFPWIIWNEMKLKLIRFSFNDVLVFNTWVSHFLNSFFRAKLNLSRNSKLQYKQIRDKYYM